MKDFSASLDMRRHKIWAHKISSCEYLSKDLQFSGAQTASFLLSIMNSSMGCWKSAVAVVHDLILVGINGKNPQQVCLWLTVHYLNINIIQDTNRDGKIVCSS